MVEQEITAAELVLPELIARMKHVRQLLIVVGLVAVVGVIAVGIILKPPGYWAYVATAILGILLSISELVSRYKDDPSAAILSTPAAVYVITNAAAAIGSLYLIHVFGWNFGVTGSARETTQVLVAGLGSAALFRSSLFNVSVGDQTIGIGPSTILTIILTAADRAVDRQRAVIRAVKVVAFMDGISFNESAEELLAYCVAAMQNVSPSEAKGIENRISDFRNKNNPKNKTVSDTIKSYILGLDLLTLVGDQVLRRAAQQLKAAQSQKLRSSTSHAPEPEAAEVSITQTMKTKVLQTLKDAGGKMLMQELRNAVGLDVSEYSLLEDLENDGQVIIQGEGKDETVRLTGDGG
jgi:uncharacterized membrane protein